MNGGMSDGPKDSCAGRFMATGVSGCAGHGEGVGEGGC